MNRTINVSLPLACSLLIAGSALAADPVKASLIEAAQALADQSSYSWRTEVEVPEGARFRAGPSTGKVEKDGVIAHSSTRGQSTTEVFLLGKKAAVTDREGKWQSLEEAEQAPGFGRFTGTMVRGIKTPAAEALEIINGLGEIKRDGEVYSGNLGEEGAKALASAGSGFGGRGGGRGGSNVVFAKATVRFWVQKGVLTKVEQVLDASLDFNGSELLIERTTTTVISEVGTTKIEVPAEARAKLE